MNEEFKKISYEDFQKVEIRVGEILSAEKIPETDKLLKLSVDFGTKFQPDKGFVPDLTGTEERHPVLDTTARHIRQIISGIALYFTDPALLVGKRCMFVTNLEPRIIKGFESNGMLFAVSTEDGKFSLLEPSVDIPPGTKAK